jgi:hypothetical protein
METPKEYHYTYYSYEEWGRGYIGSRGCKCLPEEDVRYLGSSKDKAFKPTQKIILKDDYATREEAYADEIILQRYYEVVENSHFANRAYQTSTKFYVPKEQAIEYVKKSHETQRKLGVGVHGLSQEEWIERNRKLDKRNKELGISIYKFTFEEKSEFGKKAGQTNKKNKTGIFGIPPEEKNKISKRGGNACKEMGVGMFSLSPEERSEISRKNGLKHKENGTGIFAQTPEQRSENSRKSGLKTKENGTGIFTQTPEQISERTKGTFWWNDGKIEKRSKECPGKEWISGRLKR